MDVKKTKIMHHLRLLVFLFIVSLSAAAQESIQIGQLHRISSKFLEEERAIQVYLPKGYKDTDKQYPTLYILDGQWYFFNGVAIQESMRGEYLLPEMIVVGVLMDRPGRNQTLNKQWDEFKSFLQLELVPYVNKNFRTTQENILFGWENAAFMACELILDKPGVFDGAIASNGAYIDDNMLQPFDSLNTQRYLFLANSTKDIYTVSYSNKAAEYLESAQSENLIWEYRLFKDEIHETLANVSLFQGLKFYYHNFSSLTFSSIDEFYSLGGISYAESYFKSRGERFQLSTEIDEGTKNTLIWMAWKQDRFEAFDLFMKDFSEVLETKRYASAYWQNRLAQFYLKNEAFEDAKKFFEQGITKYPEEKYLARMYHGLGQAYLGLGQKKLAKSNFKQAIKIAIKNDDPNLEAYQTELKKLG
ncbi:alpha/beta hydrolase-fold protein [Reichenbachiella sp.]|uniref:alpha/beta hydrolase-fold protein n=1 Tax=Reichenbachiella sp. TaxID=2184521 RepID=UPI003B58EE9F